MGEYGSCCHEYKGDGPWCLRRHARGPLGSLELDEDCWNGYVRLFNPYLYSIVNIVTGNLLRRRLANAKKELAEQETSFAEFSTLQASEVEGWKKKVDAFEQDSKHPNPYELPKSGKLLDSLPLSNTNVSMSRPRPSGNPCSNR